MRVAWHLGNRHLPTELSPKALRIRRDPVIEDMARGLGARVVPVEAPFNPEGGAYVKAEPSHAHGSEHHHHHGGHEHGHDHAHHGHGNDHDHDHSGHGRRDQVHHDHAHAHDHDH
jgi:urease accessory protein